MTKPDVSLQDCTISAVICAHNPTPSHLTRTLEGLRHQSLDADRWELILVDNASHERLSERFDLSWHPNARHVLEQDLGLTRARAKSIRETTSDLILFVDDDNVLEPDYLFNALRIEEQYPQLGTWGGQCLPEFEVPPPPALSKYVNALALRACDRDLWGNFLDWTDAHPYGAGMCVRRSVANAYVEKLHTDPRRLLLGRHGEALVAAEDYDIIRTGVRLGFGSGVFQSLKLTHLIPSDHVTAEYFRRLWQGVAFSNSLLLRLDGATTHDPLKTPFQAAAQALRVLLRSGWSLDRMRIEWAILKGLSNAARFPLSNQ